MLTDETSENKRRKAAAIVAQMIPTAEMLRQGQIPPVFAGDLVQLGLEHAYHDLWTRPGLDRRLRSIVTVSMMVALRDSAELKIHTAAAVRNGVTLEELEEIVIHATGYVGFPAAAGARQTMISSLREAGFIS